MRADPRAYFQETFGAFGETCLATAPGRVNLIGEHIDYHGLPVLPMALRRRIEVAFRGRTDSRIRAASAGYGVREFAWTPDLTPAAAGDWENYLRAAAQAVAGRWGLLRGIDAAVVSDLPPAAGLSSSSALIVAFSLALLRANNIHATFEELMGILPEGEHFVGTRGGGMDHAVSLAAREGCAVLVNFEPVSARPIPIPGDWGFLVAHSMKTAEKSGAVREEYNARRADGTAALHELGFASFREVPWSEHSACNAGFRAGARDAGTKAGMAGQRPTPQCDAFRHVVGEAQRVRAATEALESHNAPAFGRLLLESHASLRDVLKVSCPELDRLVEAAMDSGATGARLTGAGFGGCAVVFAPKGALPAVREGLVARFYSAHPDFDPDRHLLTAEPGAGALYLETP
ncbi:MAG: hypothetical protein LAQ30_10955 [Acidobacteriia bacterium]|nr:hypothetical protein [Terriglobia bacterium]